MPGAAGLFGGEGSAGAAGALSAPPENPKNELAGGGGCSPRIASRSATFFFA
jgi:hypothetical protein